MDLNFKVMTLRKHNIAAALAMICIPIIIGGCKEVVMPTNLEPSISNLTVSEITRTSATISAEIENHGSGYFHKFHFIYTDNNGISKTSDDFISPSGKVETSISGLKPGMTYTLTGEGIRNEVNIISDPQTFTTQSNDLPSVSGLTIVSSGPTSLIVKFDIVSDGGEAITETGCYIGKSDESTYTKIVAQNAGSLENTIYMQINPLNTNTQYTLQPYASNSVGESKGEALDYTTNDAVCLNRPGDLEIILTEGSVTNEAISIVGYMNGDDFRHLRSLCKSPNNQQATPKITLSSIDLSDVVIEEGGGSYDGNRFAKPDTITTGLFADLTNLRNIILPNAITAIERNAFSGSNLMTSLTIPANVSSLLPSADCESLESLSVSEANKNFSGHDGVVFDKDLTQIIWFPEAKTGEFTIPKTVETIGENSFVGTNIEKIIIPDGVKNIDRGAFSGSKIKEIVLPDQLQTIHEGMFQNCSYLTSVTFGTETDFIGDYVFDNTPIAHIHIRASFPPYVSQDAFSNNHTIFTTCELHVPAGCKSMYRNHSILGHFEKITED